MNLSELERVALAATPGPWEQVSAKYLSFDRGETPQVFRAAGDADFDYIAAVAPEVVLTLVRIARWAAALRKQIGDSPPMWASSLSNTITLDLFDAVDRAGITDTTEERETT